MSAKEFFYTFFSTLSKSLNRLQFCFLSLGKSLSRRLALCIFPTLKQHWSTQSWTEREETVVEEYENIEREEKLSASAHDKHHTGLSERGKVIISVDEIASSMREIFVLYIFRVASLPHRKSISTLNVTNYTIHLWYFECKHRVIHYCH